MTYTPDPATVESLTEEILRCFAGWTITIAAAREISKTVIVALVTEGHLAIPDQPFACHREAEGGYTCRDTFELEDMKAALVDARSMPTYGMGYADGAGHWFNERAKQHKRADKAEAALAEAVALLRRTQGKQVELDRSICEFLAAQEGDR